jgi:molybdopterin synthase catalytic subunit
METEIELMHITYNNLSIDSRIAEYPSSGAFVYFAGVVRNINEGKKVQFLEYEAYEQLAEREIKKILKEALEKWKLDFVDAIHRLGRLELSEIAVIVSTASEHRSEAYEANRYIIDRIKFEVPIWKKETFSDGVSEWSKGCTHGLAHDHH